MIAPGTSVGEAIALIAAALADAGIESPRLDARRLLEGATGISQERLVLEPARALDEATAMRLADFVARRAAHEPVTRILGLRSFFGRDFVVTPDTLDPRPETETLVERALAIARDEASGDAPIEVLDIGTGTGCILLTLLAELGTRARGIGVDVSGAALEVARSNAERLGLAERVSWQLVERISDIRATPGLVVSNPPYIRSSDINDLSPEVRGFDPRLALDGGADGLEVVRQIIDWSCGRTRTWFIMEFGAGQHDDVLDELEARCGGSCRRLAILDHDLGGHIRCVSWKPQT